jgi:hypothetical protein
MGFNFMVLMDIYSANFYHPFSIKEKMGMEEMWKMEPDRRRLSLVY